MSKKYNEYKGLNLTEIASKIQDKWTKEQTFEKSISSRDDNKPFVFFEGPPSANGLPGIHHVMSRSLKDIFCRYKTLQGFQVKRKAGWDTHGLPVELGVEKELGITKEDIGKKISVDDYNKACKEAVMRYTDIWNDLTVKMGYWVDMENPYVTYDSKYMETVWWLLAQLYKKDLIYKGYTIQPYSPAAGTGLSSHELNQPGCYKDVKDRTATVMFKIKKSELKNEKLKSIEGDVYFLAWTTTPWTLPSNTALAVGKDIDYVLVKTVSKFTNEKINVILAKERLLSQEYFEFGYADFTDGSGYGGGTASSGAGFSDGTGSGSGANKNKYELLETSIQVFKGYDLAGISYEQLLPFVQPDGEAFRVIVGDFVTTEDGTGIVHIAPSFGADDFLVAKQNNISALTLVDTRGKFLPEVKDGVFLYGDEYVKEAYLSDDEKQSEFQKQKQILESAGKIKELKNYLSVDERIVLKLQEEGKLFKKETYEHSYPHCWRTDKPVLYYPLDSWFIKVTDKKDRLIELNKTINWQPEATGTGRFGKWLENVNDWNLSRSRYWGIPIPIWSTEDGEEKIIIDSAEMLKNECDKAVKAGFMTENPLKDFAVGDMSDANYAKIDFHKNYVDTITLVSASGKAMKRESDLIDVWFDSGAMPYAQWHYPFENKDLIDNNKAYPADYIAEGQDQTRGWFYTLHTISTLVFDSVAYKNVMSNGMVLDKNGQKMSKRLGNTVEPFACIEKYSPDATRWYMITNAQPWDNLKFDQDGITEVQRKFFGTLYNTYSFFTLYANIDGFAYTEAEIPQNERPEIDRWVLSKLNSLVQNVEEAFDTYEPTKAGRFIQEFVNDQLSNWYVRLCRRRFWKGDYSTDKISAYQTLYTCLETVAILSSPIAPFFMDQLFCDLNAVSGKHNVDSVHLANFPKVNKTLIDKELEAQMEIAQNVSSLVLGLRKKVNLRVRQPLQKIMVPALSADFAKNIQHVQDLILSEVNVKELELLQEGNSMLVKSIKANFKTIGPKYGKQMKDIVTMVSHMNQHDIAAIEANNGWSGEIDNVYIDLDINDFEIQAQDIPGWLVSSENGLTVALDITLSEDLKREGIARELINRVQNLRKDSGLEVTDKIRLTVECSSEIQQAIAQNQDYVCNEVLASEINFGSLGEEALVIDLVETSDAKIELVKK